MSWATKEEHLQMAREDQDLAAWAHTMVEAAMAIGKLDVARKWQYHRANESKWAMYHLTAAMVVGQ